MYQRTSSIMRHPGFFEKFVRIVVGMVLIAVVSGCGSSQDSTARPDAVKVRVARVTTKELHPNFDVVGIVLAEPDHQAALTAATPGLIDTLLVHEGDTVKKGATIVSLDDRKARIDLARATAAYTRLIAPARPEELAQARASVEKADAAHVVSSRRLENSRALRKRSPDLVPEVQILEDQHIDGAARADLETARAQLLLLQQGPRAELRDEARVEMEAAQLQLDLCRVVAPFDGVVVDMLARPGQRADVGTPIARITDTSEVVVQARIPANQLDSISRALSTPDTPFRATITTPSLADETFAATTAWLNQQTEGSTSDVAIKFRVHNPKSLLRIGMSVKVGIAERPEVGLAIPEAAISVNVQGERLVTVVREGAAVPTVIQISSDTTPAVRASGMIRVLGGLSAGDQIAVSNGFGLPAGTPVEVLDEN